MRVAVLHSALVSVDGGGCYRRGALWFSDAGRVSRRVQRAIERAVSGASAVVAP